MEKLVPIIILNWNGEDDTIECLVSIKKSNSAGFFPILVDNGSQKNSLVKIKNICQNLFSDIHSFKSDFVMQRSAINSNKLNFVVSEETLVIIESSQNLGFAKGNNLGIKFAAMIGSEWVMLLNNDTIVTENTFSILKNFIMENTSFIAITPQIRLYNDKEKIWNCGGELTYFGSRKYFFESDHYTLLPGDRKYKKITFVTGCALLFKFKSTGFLSEDYFFGEEDYEFSLRLKDNQMDMACVFGSVIFHKVGASRLDGNKSLSGIYILHKSIN